MIEGLTWYQLCFAALGTLAVSLFVSAIGPTGGLQLAVVAAALPPSMAIPVHAWITGVSALFRAWTLRTHIDWRYCAFFIPTTVAAAGLAIRIAFQIDTRVLELLVGAFVLSSTIRTTSLWSPPRIVGNPLLAGAGTGFLTIFIGATGPVLFAMMSQRFDDRQKLMGTHSACLVAQHASKVVLFGAMGVTILKYPVLLMATTLAAWIGTFAGASIMASMNEQSYRRLVSLLMFGSGCIIVGRALLAFHH